MHSPRDDWKQVIETKTRSIINHWHVKTNDDNKRHERRFRCRLYSKREERKGEVVARARQGFYKSLKVKVSARASQGQTNVSQGQCAPHFLRRLGKSARGHPPFWGVKVKAQGPRSAGARVHTKSPPPQKKKKREKVS